MHDGKWEIRNGKREKEEEKLKVQGEPRKAGAGAGAGAGPGRSRQVPAGARLSLRQAVPLLTYY